MQTSQSPEPTFLPGTARLTVVVPVAIASIFYAAILDYALPLYFGALKDAAARAGGSYPYDMWSHLVKYQVTPWLVGPILAGVLARRFGERRIWSAALLAMALVPAVLLLTAHPRIVKLLALWQGLAGALTWIAGMSLVQMVAPSRKALSNALMMASLGAGSILGPLIGRALLYRGELANLLSVREIARVSARLLSLEPAQTTPDVPDFTIIFWILTFVTLACGVLVGLWGQRPGQFSGQPTPTWSQISRDLSDLTRNARFWALVIVLCVIGGPIFQAANQYLPYRADELGLKSGAADHGWLWLQLLKTLMWLPGGLAVGLIAGRRAPGAVGAAILVAFALAALGIGYARSGAMLFCFVAAFEFVRQFMRWSHAGYVSEHLPDHLRATAIGLAITLSGSASTAYAWIADFIWRPGDAGFNSSQPFWAVGIAGVVGAVALLVFDQFMPIRDIASSPPAEIQALPTTALSE